MRRPSKPTADSAPNLGLASFTHASDEQGLSLDRLSSAYAELLERGAEPYEPLPGGQGAETEASDAGDDDALADDAGPPDAPGPSEAASSADEHCEITPRSIVEAALFVGSPGGEPITCEQLAGVMRGVSPREVEELIRELNELYQRDGCPYHVAPVKAGFALRLRPEFQPLQDKVRGRLREARLTRPAIEVLALAAYQQPVTREAIDAARGKPSGALLAQLVRRQLLRVERGPPPRREARYHTTDRFLQFFRIDSLKDLPHAGDPERSL